MLILELKSLVKQLGQWAGILLFLIDMSRANILLFLLDRLNNQ